MVNKMTPHTFFLETLAIFLGDVLAAAFIASLGYCYWYVMKYPGFYVGANWDFRGWDLNKMGRLPNASDSGTMEFIPNICVISYDAHVKKVIHSVWVRERADLNNPGTVLGHRDLKKDGVIPEARTTGGDMLAFHGPKIVCPASEMIKITKFPVFIETSDGAFYKAVGGGNNPTGPARLREHCRNAKHKIKQQFFSLRAFLRRIV
jgi:hypothetical protein